ncbi:uncharacterized protein ELE39_000683 [Cryptosporidium sp. chipmunk genotype I]|uniref:uncharacterized protein n=1 Tax=Cryptosporidium sp. chipmunk genotype I TaxID=1280935 RepID=UPI00351A0C6F|nr:secreted protein [Cryptosporidium sp. chipmunk genotype I]
MKYYLPFSVLFFIVQVYFSNCSETSENSEEDVVLVQASSALNDYRSAIEAISGGSPYQEFTLDPAQLQLISEISGSGGSCRFVVVNEEQPQFQVVDDGMQSSQLVYTNQQIQVPTPIPMQGINQRMQFNNGGMVQWIGGPVNFESMVDCKFYRQNPGFCVPMSIYTPCSRCKARVRTIFRTSYKVRCPGQESFPAQLRPYFTWVPTSHRNPKREKGIFSRWRRQFMCIVMAISDIPKDLSLFWQNSQITFDSAYEAPQYVPLLLGPYGDQSTSLGYATGTNFFATTGLNPQNVQNYIRNQNSEGNPYEVS